MKGRSAFTDAISLWELKQVLRYEDIVQDNLVPFDLGQDALAWPSIGTRKSLMTIIKNVGLVFWSQGNRWLTPSECLLAQGFSVTLESKVHAESTSFDVPRAFPRNQSAMFMQAGNSMNVHMIGLALVWALVFPNHPPQTQTGPSSSSSSVEGKKDAKKCETKEKQTLVARDFFALTFGKRPRV